MYLECGLGSCRRLYGELLFPKVFFFFFCGEEEGEREEGGCFCALACVCVHKNSVGALTPKTAAMPTFFFPMLKVWCKKKSIKIWCFSLEKKKTREYILKTVTTNAQKGTNSGVASFMCKSFRFIIPICAFVTLSIFAV